MIYGDKVYLREILKYLKNLVGGVVFIRECI